MSKRRAAVLVWTGLWMGAAGAVPALSAPSTQPAPSTEAAVRQPKYPLKTQRMVYTDAEIATARENVAKYPAAKKVQSDVLKVADRWVAMSDEKLRSLLTSAQVPRAFETGTAGCPKCGHEIYQKYGQYGWIIDPDKPFKVKCPNCGSVYPSNDYDAYYQSAFKEKKGWDSDYVDDGWGWKDPKTGEKFWFVAFYNHWMWHRELVPGIRAMAQAYLLTGDRKYAHKAAVALERIAEVYPAMDYENQSRYGQMMKAKGGHYPGKVVNLIWETGLITALAEAYDSVWETIDADQVLQKETGKSGQEIRAFVEANLLEDAIDAVFKGQIEGNFGMHQRSLVSLSLARQYGDMEKWLGGLVNRSTEDDAKLGLNYALYNLVYRDGLPSESSPHYNGLWVGAISGYAPMLKRAGYDVMSIPKTRRLYDGILEQICARQFTPDLGDAGSVWGDHADWAGYTFTTAARAYGDERYANYVASAGMAGEKGFSNFDALMHKPIEATSSERPAQASRLLAGYGAAILNNPADNVAMSLYYGLKAGHGHYDRLNFEIFAHGQPIVPDLGYPDAMNDFVPGIFTWSKNTVSHNCVVVDAHRQSGNVAGQVELFADSPFARAVDIEAKGTYRQCMSYRRGMVMVDAGPESYFVDFSTVVGGKEHDYSLHGPPGAFELTGAELSAPAEGTLAGKDVKLGEIYDQPELSEKTGFGSYKGSGFQHLYHVQHVNGGDWVAQWQHAKDAHAHVRMRILPQEGQEVMVAEAHVSPVKYQDVLHYLIARRQGGDALSSRFVSVIEPYGGKPVIDAARQIKLEQGEGMAVEVKRGGERDVIVYDPSGSKKTVGGIETDARAAVVTFAAGAEEPTRVFFAGGTRLAAAGKQWGAQAVEGQVAATDPAACEVRIKGAGQVDPKSLIGRPAFFANDLHQTVHPIASARVDGADLVLKTQDDLLVGRAKVTAGNEAAVRTNTALPLPEIYPGTTLTTADYHELGRVRQVTKGRLTLAAPMAGAGVKAGDEVWMINVGSGDRLRVPSVFWWSSAASESPVRH